MAPRKRESRIYTRRRGGQLRYYADFRDFADVGGRQEALRAPHDRVATTDPDIASELASRRLRELEHKRRKKHILGIDRESGLARYAAYHLREKARAGNLTETWLERAQRHLEAAVHFFGEARDLRDIDAREAQRFVSWLAQRPSGRGIPPCPSCGRRAKPPRFEAEAELHCDDCGATWRVPTANRGTQRKYLNSLSNLYRRAAAEGYVEPGFNPVAALLEKPTARAHEARWLEVHEAALLLEAAQFYRPHEKRAAMQYAYPLVATFLLAGGRESEVLGLEIEDISFDRRTVTFRPNRWRRLKTSSSRRTVPLWPQLEEILRAYLYGGDSPRVSGLLFPSVRLETEGMVTDLRKMLDGVAQLAGWNAGDIRSKAFRHTYCAARLQTLDRGHPVSEYTVARELGHGGFQLVRRVYGHLGEVRHRSSVVEYRADQHQHELGDRLRRLRAARARATAERESSGAARDGESAGARASRAGRRRAVRGPTE
ncbi:MAG: tyrosine-type recombinase/integrase [Longimicrobiales bacterium]